MLKKIKKISALAQVVLIAIIVAGPFLVQAQGVNIPCTGTTGSECDFNKLIELAANILTFLILISIPLAAVAFAWAGFLFLTAAGNEGQVSKAKEIFTKVLIGFIFVLTAWIIVRFVTTSILNDDNYKDLLDEGAPSVMRDFVPEYQAHPNGLIVMGLNFDTINS